MKHLKIFNTITDYENAELPIPHTVLVKSPRQVVYKRRDNFTLDVSKLDVDKL